MSDLPAPLVAAEVDLRDFQFMPLDVLRLRDSDLSSRVSGDEFRAAVLLWCASWHQKPAASLPDDDVVLSALAGYGRVVREWQTVREGALHGWVKCSDGRLYHSVVAEKANEAWTQKQIFAWRRECDRVRKENVGRARSGKPPLEFPARPGTVPAERVEVPAETEDGSEGIPAENALKGQGPEQNRTDRILLSAERERDARADFAKFWEKWDHKVNRGAAEAAFLRANADLESILAGVARYIASRSDDQQWPDPAKWLDARRWEDNPAPRAARSCPRPSALATLDAKRAVPGKVYVLRDSPAGNAWMNAAKRRGRTQLWDRDGGWLCDSEFPPPDDQEPLNDRTHH